MEEVKTVFQIPEDNMELLQAKINKLNKTAVKLNCNPITCNIIKEEIREIKEEGKQIKYIKFIHIEVKGESPIISGWEFLGTIQHEKTGNILRILPGNENIDLTYYYNIAPICDHCNTKRRRKDTYLIQSESGEIKQIGKSCLKDFLGHANPQQIASYMEYLLNLEDHIQEELSFKDGNNKTYIPTIEFLNFAAEFILQYGFMSKSKFQELTEQGINSAIPTANRVLNAMFPMPRVEPEIKEKDITEKAITLSEKALQWARNELEARNNQYLHNLKISVAGEFISFRNTGFAASLIPAYQREVEKIEFQKKEKELKAKSNFYGNIKDKIEKELTLQKVFTFETDFGLCHIYKFVDVEGNIFVWKTSKYIAKEEGEAVKVKGTIKEHNEYRGEKQTVLTRCKII